MRVCFFNRSYWPDTGATGQLLTELAEDLAAKHGMNVTVIAGRPLAADGPVPAREVRNGVSIIRARGTTWPPRSFAGRAMNYLTYFASATVAGLRVPRPDVVVAMTDPPIIGLAALAARRGAVFVFVCQDIFPEVAALIEDFRSPLVDRALDVVSRFLVRRADRIVVLGETMARRLVEGKGAEPRKIDVIHNWADTDAIQPAGKRNPFSIAHGLDRQTVVLHAGNIGLSQDLDTVIEAAERLRDRTDIVVVFIGDGSRRAALEADVSARGLRNVRFLPFQPRPDMRWTYATSDICLVTLKAGLAGCIVPSKLYPILAAGRPYVAAVDADSEVASLTATHECGVRVAPGDADAMAACIRRLADDEAARRRMGANGRALSARFARERQVAAYAEVFTRAARAGR